jgi:hypothetical protein
VQTFLTADAGYAHALRRALRPLSHPYVLLLLTALAVWLPQGFNIGPVNDGWIQMGGGVLRLDPGRIFGNIPMHVGMLISPRSFVGIQFVMLTLMLLHATLFYEVVRRLLPGRELIALAAGLIGLFHSADRSYFWPGAMGLQFSLVTALASGVCAIQYLDHGGRRHLAATIGLQLLSVFTYPAFVPLILGIPSGAWLLRRLAGARPPAAFLLKVNIVLIVAAITYLCALHAGIGRNSKVADVHLAAAASGYAWAFLTLLRSLPAVFEGLRPMYVVSGLALAVLAYPAAAKAAERSGPAWAGTATGWRYLTVVVAGLLLLALLSYLPYSISKVRFSQSRALLVCGMCAYTALVVVLLAALEAYVHRAWLSFLIMALAGYTVLAGVGERDSWVRLYRAEERLLAGIAAVMPHPIPGTVFLIHLHDQDQIDDLDGFYNRQRTFSLALEQMYADRTLKGGFYGFEDDQVSLDADGVSMRGFRGGEGPLERYPSMVVLDYPADGPVRLLDTAWLEQQAGANAAAAAAYHPRFGGQPAADAIMCSTLEPGFRPAYCR